MAYTEDQLIILYEDKIVAFLLAQLIAGGYTNITPTSDYSISVLASSLGGDDTIIVNWMKAGDQNTSRTGGSTGYTTEVHNFAVRIVMGIGMDDHNAKDIKTLLGACKKYLQSRAFRTTSGITAGAIRLYRVPSMLWFEDKVEKSMEGLIHFELTIDESIVDYGG